LGRSGFLARQKASWGILELPGACGPADKGPGPDRRSWRWRADTGAAFAPDAQADGDGKAPARKPRRVKSKATPAAAPRPDLARLRRGEGVSYFGDPFP
jgi:hypothetical protein